MNENSEEQPIQFASEGFDLDALKDCSETGRETNSSNKEKNEDAILEIGGGVTRMSVESPKSNSKTTNDTSSSAASKKKEENPELLKCESLKLQGNNFFKARNWLDAYDSYTEAIDACPPQSLRGIDILKQKQEWENEQHRQALDDYREQKHDTKGDTSGKDEGTNDEQTSSSSHKDDNKDEESSKPSFQVPPHPHGDKYLSVYHCNRAACCLHLEQYKEAIDDCTIALLWKPDYVKAYMRRCHAHEQLEQLTEALEDVKMAQTLDPRNAQLRKDQQRLQRKNDEHLEKLKEQTMGQLKDLGNSILGNFGLSLDNFQAKQDPSTGSYSISFDQGNNGGGN